MLPQMHLNLHCSSIYIQQVRLYHFSIGRVDKIQLVTCSVLVTTCIVVHVVGQIEEGNYRFLAF